MQNAEVSFAHSLFDLLDLVSFLMLSEYA
ncbi:uncharacterized protein METZ01_LOCUS344236, partial [marine metagenome]